MPWSFVKNDNLWILVLACNDCNLQKSDKITTKFYLESMLERNYNLVSIREPIIFIHMKITNL
ncbi:HNH endonuclease domain-containing protein [Lysinibacillus sphaericus]|uniref:HNH endonuclease domain-containing protein n=1 Tax=Lysinibacillus sphaericus TaxID=1421 RepID=UPI002107E7B2|nr:HNH endonuclease domain-containing protein [Lysinibacillus sp. SDF0037]